MGETASTPQTANDKPANPPGDDDGPLGYSLDLQLAIDGIAAGDTDPVRHYLARKMGLDPDKCQLRVGPWTLPAQDEGEGGARIEYLGKMDNVLPPGYDRGSFSEREPPPRVLFTSVSNPFQYDQLDTSQRQFRLIRLAPPDSGGITHELELRTFSLEDTPPYFCLSYVWGEPKRFLPITCNGAKIELTQNLYHALQTCFNRFSDAWLWADGICINQDDIEERSQQVMLMRDIYHQASMVLAHPGHFRYALNEDAEGDVSWGVPGVEDENEVSTVLAEAPQVKDEGTESKPSDENENEVSGGQIEAPQAKDEGTEPKLSDGSTSPIAGFDHGAASQNGKNARESISIMTYLCRIWGSSSDYEIKSDAEWTKYKLPDFESEEGRKAWARLVEFWSQDWFSRTWVLQELVLAKKVVVLYGETAISLDAVMEFWTEARKHGLPRVLRIGVLADACARVMHLSPVSQLKAFREQRQRENQGEEDEPSEPEVLTKTRLLDLLALTRNGQATDDRDKIYALLGLADDEVAQGIVPDYSPRNTASRLYIDVARRFVDAGLGSELLHQAGLDTKTPDLPSWVPDWTFQSRSAMTTQLYRCMGSTTPMISICPSYKNDELPKLVVRGAELSSLKFVSAAWRYYSHDPSEPSFSQFANASDLEIPLFNDEDARNFILNMALLYEPGSSGKRYAGEGWENAVARTLAADCSWDGRRIGVPAKDEEKEKDPASEFRDAFEAFREFYNKGPKSEDDLKRPGVKVHQSGIFMWLLEFDKEKEDELQKRMIPFTTSIQEAQKGRRFALLSGWGGRKTKVGDRGFIASVPYNAEKQDLVVMLEGFSTPFVLRKCEEDSGDEYRLVGDCYVHGVMDGEMLRDVGEVQEQLEAGQIMTNETGNRYALWTPKGYAKLKDFIII